MKPVLTIKTVTLRAADLGPKNPLPSVLPVLNVQTQKSPALGEEDEIFFDIGKIRTIYPYTQQNLYGRELREKEFRAAVLENDFLKATFLPELGGRLWSLYDKTAGRELLYVNDCIRLCNLALRNAWFSGGVEWNIGMIGHSPFTCAPLFTETLEADDSTPVLRMYEYERLRNVTYQMDFSLPQDSRFLLCRMRIVNLNRTTVPMYWWSNIAVPEQEGGRVIVPAEASYYSFWNTIGKIRMPYRGKREVSYPTHTECSMDYFYITEDKRQKYIAAVGPDGYGLLQTSTSRLKGRKLFVWGQGQGGRNWQHFLTDQAGSYAEIQAGLGRTQYECLPMPPLAAWEWEEAYGAIQVGETALHGPWEEARREVAARVEALMPEEQLETRLAADKRDSVFRTGHPVLSGSGSGGLENARRTAAGEPPLSEHLPFGAPGREEQHWAELLATGRMPCPPADEAPQSYMVGERWMHLLEASLEQDENNWYAWYHYGLMTLQAGEIAAAADRLGRSLSLMPTAWAWYALAGCRYTLGDAAGALQAMREALCLRPQELSLLRDAFRLLSEAGEYTEIRERFSSLEETLKQDGKLKFYEADACAHTGNPAAAEAILQENGGLIIPDIREGETSLTNLWLYLEEQKCRREGRAADQATAEVPPRWDFRMGNAEE